MFPAETLMAVALLSPDFEGLEFAKALGIMIISPDAIIRKTTIIESSFGPAVLYIVTLTVCVYKYVLSQFLELFTI